MFGKDKSPEFVEQMYRDKTGSNNPMFGKKHTPQTLAKLKKPVWVYDNSSKELIKMYDGSMQLKKEMKMGYDTLKKYLDSNKSFKGKLFKSSPFEDNE